MSDSSDTSKTKAGQTKPDAPIRVIIIEDMRDVREGLKLLINGSPGFHCAGGYRSVEDALAAVAGLEPPDIILTDLGLPGMSGIEGIRLFREWLPDAAIMALTIHENDDKIFNALCAGATGYLVKTTKPAKILEAIRDVCEGGAPMSSNIARMIVGSFRRTTLSPLSPREKEVLAELCKGYSYKMIADALFIGERTVNFHIKNIYQKLQVHSKSEAVLKALRERLV